MAIPAIEGGVACTGVRNDNCVILNVVKSLGQVAPSSAEPQNDSTYLPVLQSSGLLHFGYSAINANAFETCVFAIKMKKPKCKIFSYVSAVFIYVNLFIKYVNL